jgi:hypothetical protein
MWAAAAGRKRQVGEERKSWKRLISGAKNFPQAEILSTRGEPAAC